MRPPLASPSPARVGRPAGSTGSAASRLRSGRSSVRRPLRRPPRARSASGLALRRSFLFAPADFGKLLFFLCRRECLAASAFVFVPARPAAAVGRCFARRRSLCPRVAPRARVASLRPLPLKASAASAFRRVAESSDAAAVSASLRVGRPVAAASAAAAFGQIRGFAGSRRSGSVPCGKSPFPPLKFSLRRQPGCPVPQCLKSQPAKRKNHNKMEGRRIFCVRQQSCGLCYRPKLPPEAQTEAKSWPEAGKPQRPASYRSCQLEGRLQAK